MDTVTVIAGHHVQFAEVYLFVTQYVMPSLWGVGGAAATEVLKYLGVVDPSGTARRWVLRGTVALCCLALNLAGALAVHETIGLGFVLQTLWSYLLAVTAYDHAR
ncbi:MAG TPA: hypothetical protein VD866_30860 [Urbifossiella sp.]|nr:hypothetical protein [Urbifossiella sp.]